MEKERFRKRSGQEAEMKPKGRGKEEERKKQMLEKEGKIRKEKMEENMISFNVNDAKPERRKEKDGGNNTSYSGRGMKQ